MIEDNDDVDGDDDGNAMHCGDGFTHSQITSHHLFKWQVGQNKRHQGISKNILHCFKEVF